MKFSENVALGRAALTVFHRRPNTWKTDPSTGLLVPDRYELIGDPETVWNLITTVGRDFMHRQCYGTSGLGSNGQNWVAVSDDVVTETSASTTLSNEITLNGFARAQATVTLPTGTNQTTLDKTFTASGSQSMRKAALFTASSGGIMNHVLGFSQRVLASGDTLQLVFTITLG